MKNINLLTGSIAVLSVLTLGTVSLDAQVSRPLEVLQTNPDSRTAALGDVLGARQDRMSLFTSPLALIPAEGSFGIDASTQIYPAIDGVDGRVMQYNVAAGYKFLDRHAVTLSFRYQGAPKIEAFNGISTPGQENYITPFEWAADAAYGFQISRDFSAMVSGNLIASYIGYGSYTGSFSVGGFYNHAFGDRSVVAAALKLNAVGAPLNYGAGMAFALPSNIQVSGEYGLNLDEKNHLDFLLGVTDYFIPADANLLLIGVGAEYDWDDLAFVRLGYRYGQNKMSRFTAGLGVKLFHRYALDAAYSHGTDKAVGLDVWSVGLTTRF